MRSKKQQTVQAPATRMNLRSYRNVPLVPMETSSSDDSCDSFGSDGFANTKKILKPTRVSPRRAKTSEVTSEEDTCSSFEDKNFNEEMSTMNVDSDGDLEEPEPEPQPGRRTRRTHTLKVALKFPPKKSAQKRLASKPSLPAKESDSDVEEGGHFLSKRDLNIKENKAMLAKLMAEINKVPGLFPKRLSLPMANTPRRVPRQSLGTPTRRNPERTSRIHTRSRTQVDGPPSPLSDDDPEDKFSLVRKSRFYEEVEEPREPRRRSYNGVMAIPHVVRSVEEVTENELDNICTNVREKVYSSSMGSTCHQCRQKTTDTKTSCHNPECVGVRGQFCGPCLRNRYGEEVRSALLDPEWLCPPCRGICNCSFCRAREGRCATGVLVYLAKYHGYDNVHSYLKSLRKALEEEEDK
ncbi:cell division cycle-associated protein 7a isoform X2 [Clupea harengus]|uniref:Cell division cycle-associated protein 7a isoform X2 n=1 Tax=Clupea harengus TaxID=7950 RepID=A0A8M1KGB5_CLUHA|nr:cell division cycle-associated protein 7a isoform X2 [Clupea harengus]